MVMQTISTVLCMITAGPREGQVAFVEEAPFIQVSADELGL